MLHVSVLWAYFFFSPVLFGKSVMVKYGVKELLLFKHDCYFMFLKFILVNVKKKDLATETVEQNR